LSKEKKMKRHETLIPLTHDHHHALAAIRRLAVAANGTDEERDRASRQFLWFFSSHTIMHFRDEEEIFFPLVGDAPKARGTMERAMLEHAEIQAAVHCLACELEDGVPGAASIPRIVDLFRSHIRFEEKVVFPMIESLSSVKLDSVKLRQRTRATVTP
jgi:hemerythrin-like domain-containing protein